MAVRLLYCGSGWLSFTDILAARMPRDWQLAIWDRSTPLERVLAAGEVEVLLPSNAPIAGSLLSSSRGLRLIQQPAAGTDAIDLEAARACGIPVCNAPGANDGSVAEAALLLMLGLSRRLPEVGPAFAAGTIGGPTGRELAGRRLGVVGVGPTGRAVARLGEALGMTVTAVGSRRTGAEWRALLSDSDVVSLHCPLTDATRGLIDDRALSLMKPGALLINCARGPVIDRAALERALAGGRLGGVGLDVFWHEPWDPADPLFAHPRVMVLPHVAGSTEEAFGRIADLTIENTQRAARGAPLLHRVA